MGHLSIWESIEDQLGDWQANQFVVLIPKQASRLLAGQKHSLSRVQHDDRVGCQL